MHCLFQMSTGMFLDGEAGMGIWTRHVAEDGKVYYYNMKRQESRWDYELQGKHPELAETRNEVRLREGE